MRETMDIGGPVSSPLVTDGHFENLEIEFGRPEQQIEITEGIELAEI